MRPLLTACPALLILLFFAGEASARFWTSLPPTVKHADLEIRTPLMLAIQRSEQKKAILEYLANRAVRIDDRIQYIEIVDQTLLPNETRAKAPVAPQPPAPPRPSARLDAPADLKISDPLMTAILASDQRMAILAYLRNYNLPRVKREQYLETVRQTLLPEFAKRPGGNREVPVDLKIPDALMKAIEKSDQKDAILDYLLNPAVKVEMRRQYLETVRANLLPDMAILAELPISDALRKAIEKSDQKDAILGYLANPTVKLEMRLQYLDTVRQTLLPDEKAPARNPVVAPAVKRIPIADLKLPDELLQAIEKSGQKDSIHEYLTNPAVMPEFRAQFIETTARTLLPGRNPEENAAKIGVPDDLAEAIDASTRKLGIRQYLTQPLVVPEHREVCVEAIRRSLLQGGKK